MKRDNYHSMIELSGVIGRTTGQLSRSLWVLAALPECIQPGCLFVRFMDVYVCTSADAGHLRICLSAQVNASPPVSVDYTPASRCAGTNHCECQTSSYKVDIGTQACSSPLMVGYEPTTLQALPDRLCQYFVQVSLPSSLGAHFASGACFFMRCRLLASC